MNHTSPFNARVILQLEEAHARYRSTLKRTYQPLLDELFHDMRLSIIEFQDAGYALKLEAILLQELFTVSLKLKRLREEFSALQRRDSDHRMEPREAPLSRSGPVDPGIGFDDDPQD